MQKSELRPVGKSPHFRADFDSLMYLLAQKTPFTFVRFSDGESEILHRRRLSIKEGVTQFQGRSFENSFPEWDSKTYTPIHGTGIRSDLFAAASFNEHFFFKGILTSSNRRNSEKFTMQRFAGGSKSNLTFTDLLVNVNFHRTLRELLPLITETRDDLFVIANYRSEMRGQLSRAELIPVQDNFFANYVSNRDEILSKAEITPYGSTLLSSASSMSNVIGHRLRISRPDLTFLDVGTAVNGELGLLGGNRGYMTNPEKLWLKRVGSILGFRKDYVPRW